MAVVVFFFKQKTAYEMRISDWSSDVCSSDLANRQFGAKKIGLMLINNPWGQSNQKGLEAADEENDSAEIVGAEKFEAADVDMVPQLTRLQIGRASCRDRVCQYV